MENLKEIDKKGLSEKTSSFCMSNQRKIKQEKVGQLISVESTSYGHDNLNDIRSVRLCGISCQLWKDGEAVKIHNYN